MIEATTDQAQPQSATALAQIAESFLSRLPNFTIGSAICKWPNHDWKQYQGQLGLVGTAQNWRRATSIYVMAADELGAVIEIDDPVLKPVFLDRLPVLHSTAGWTRTDPEPEQAHGGWIVRLHHPITDKAHSKIRDANGDERASLRLKRAIQLVYGDHYDKRTGQPTGNRYIFNGEPVVTLSAEETDLLMSIFELQKTAPDDPPRTRSVTAPMSANIDDWQVRKVWKYIDGYLDELKTQRAGRNDFINDRTAWNIGRLAHYVNDDGQLLDLIFDAAITCGYVGQDGERQARATIQSGFEAGQREPRYPFTRRETPGPTPEGVASASALVASPVPAGETSAPEPALTTPAPTASAAPTVKAVAKLITLSAGRQRAVDKFFGRARGSVTGLLVDVMNNVGESWFTVPALSRITGKHRKLYERALDEYGAIVFFERKELTAETCDSLIGISSPLGGVSPYCRTVTGYRFRPDFAEIFVSEIVDPYLEDHYVLPKASRTRLHSLGYTDFSVLAGLNEQILAALTDGERNRYSRKRKEALADRECWQQELADAEPLPMPIILDADGMVDTEATEQLALHPADAPIVRNAIEALGEQQSYSVATEKTGREVGQIRRTEQRYGLMREETFSLVTLEIEPDDSLPSMDYVWSARGFPVRFTVAGCYDENGEAVSYDYRGKVGYHEAQRAHADGETLIFSCQQASTIRFQDPEEKQALTDKKAAAAQERKKRAVSRAGSNPAEIKQAVREVEPHVGPGNDPRVTVRWCGWLAKKGIELPGVERIAVGSPAPITLAPTPVLLPLACSPETLSLPAGPALASSEPADFPMVSAEPPVRLLAAPADALLVPESLVVTGLPVGSLPSSVTPICLTPRPEPALVRASDKLPVSIRPTGCAHGVDLIRESVWLADEHAKLVRSSGL